MVQSDVVRINSDILDRIKKINSNLNISLTKLLDDRIDHQDIANSLERIEELIDKAMG